MARFCANCGTEVDDSAVFCPTCGQPIDQADETEMPPAPAWPKPTEDEEPADEGSVEEGVVEEPTRVEERPVPPPVAASAPAAASPPDRPPRPAAPRREGPALDLPLTMPVTLSAWLIGVGSFVAALGVIVSLFGGFLNVIEILLVLALLGVAATVFLSASLPAIPQLRLVTMVVVLIAFGIALDRLAFGAAGIGELLLFLGTAAAAIGAIILELGRDQPLGGAAG